MNKVWIIAKRELSALFDSLTAYIMLALFLGLSGFFTWLFGHDIFFLEQASLAVFFETAYWTLFFFIPAITMRMVAEEKRSGTIEMLLTKAVDDWQVIAGKFLACWLLVVIALAFTIPYYITVSWLGPVDHGGTAGGYLALLLIGGAYTSIGIFTSTLTKNQIIAFLLAIFAGLFFQIIFNVLYNQLTPPLSGFFYFLSFNTHFDTMSRGVVDSRNLLYFASIILAGLFFAQSILAKRNMKN